MTGFRHRPWTHGLPGAHVQRIEWPQSPRNQRRAAFLRPRSSLRNAQAWWTSPRAWTNPSRGGGVTSTTMVRPRRSRWAIHFMGHTVCTKAAMTLMRVGTERLARVMDGRPDGRRDRPHVPGKMTTSVWRFLWRLYHSVAEGMPDKFNFASQDAQTMIVAVAGPGRTL